MLEYPADLPDWARTQIDRALVNADDQFRQTRERTRPGTFASPVRFVVLVFDHTAKIICKGARERSWTAEKLRADLSRWLKQLIDETYTQKAHTISTLSVGAFQARIRAELERHGTWQVIQDTLRERAVNQSVTVPTKKSSSFPQWLRRKMDEGRWNYEDVVDAVIKHTNNHNFNRFTLGRHLNGDSDPSTNNQKAYEAIFGERYEGVIRRRRVTRTRRTQRRVTQKPPKRH